MLLGTEIDMGEFIKGALAGRDKFSDSFKNLKPGRVPKYIKNHLIEFISSLESETEEE